MSGLIPSKADLSKAANTAPNAIPRQNEVVNQTRGDIGFARVAIAMGVALGADGFQWLIPPLWWFADGFAFIALLVIFGLRIPIFLFLIVEIIPGIALFPTWTLAVLALVSTHKSK